MKTLFVNDLNYMTEQVCADGLVIVRQAKQKHVEGNSNISNISTNGASA